MGRPLPDDAPYTDYPPPRPVIRPAAPRRPERRWKYVVLFLITILTTTVAGALHYASYLSGFSNVPPDLTSVELYAGGLWYSVAILAILGLHELGHYYTCRHHGVDASMPYFLPAPLPLTGTLGAFIRIRQPIATKRQLFDIGIAGPIAGFVVAVPALLAGMAMSKVIPLPKEFEGLVIELGEPLLFQAAAWLVFGPVPEGYTINMHPMAFAAWFGLLATALNLFPIGQLDGGHISYAVLGRKSTLVTLGTVLCLVGLTFVSTSWVVWTVLTVGMLIAFGPRHPRTVDEDVPLDRSRMLLALFALIMFVLCFTPAPLEPIDIVARP